MPETFPAPPELYAEVAVPASVTQTYTYRIPAAYHAMAGPGCRVVVPFGRQTLIGYVVAIHEQLPAALAAKPAGQPSAVKDIADWIDETPVINDEILKLTQWVADYYYAPWGETLKVALPPGLDVRLEDWIDLTEDGRQAVQTGSVSPRTRNGRLLAWLAEVGGAVRLDDLPPDRFGKNPRQVARELEHMGLVSVTTRTGEATVRFKRRLVVRRIERPADQPERPLSPAQARVLAYLDETPTALVSELVAEAEVSPAVLRQMAKKGWSKLRRRPSGATRWPIWRTCRRNRPPNSRRNSARPARRFWPPTTADASAPFCSTASRVPAKRKSIWPPSVLSCNVAARR